MFQAPKYFLRPDSDSYRKGLFGYKTGMEDNICIALFSYTIPFYEALKMINTINTINEAPFEDLMLMSRAQYPKGLTTRYDPYPDNYLWIDFPRVRKRNDGNPIEYSLTETENGQGIFNILLHYDEQQASLKREAKQ
jgi:hypothetical protein